MAVRIDHITFDCANAYEQSRFWAGVTGFAEDPEDSTRDEEVERDAAELAAHPSQWVHGASRPHRMPVPSCDSRRGTVPVRRGGDQS